jgi:hypothetical protein
MTLDQITALETYRMLLWRHVADNAPEALRLLAAILEDPGDLD